MTQVNETIKIIIRTTNNKYADFSIEISSLLTVYDLKQNITLNHTTKPITKNQRLIYSGKLLADKNILNQVFIKSTSGSSFMVHLVLDSDKNESTSKTPMKSSIINKESPSVSLHSDIYEQYIRELNKYQQQLQQFMLNPNGISSISNSERQAYLQYCYTHHQMYQNYLVYQRSAISTRSSPIIPVTIAANTNEFDQENNLLGILHILIEVFVLYSIMYFYTTFNRFLFLFLIFTLLYLNFRGYLSIQQRRRAQIQQVPPVIEQAVANNIEQEIDEETDTEQIQNENENSNDHQHEHSSSVPPEPIIDNQITPMRLFLNTVSTFFSSLIPERPQRI